MTTYSLSSHRIAFSEGFDEIQIVSCTSCTPPDPVETLGITESPVEVVVDLAEFTVAIVMRDGGIDPDRTVQINTLNNAVFGLDSMCAGGVGISDLRDDFREMHHFDLRACRLTFQLVEVKDAEVKFMEMAGKGNTPNVEYYTRRERKKCCF